MKANEAPEKIYVHEASAPELTENLPYHIEYIRTDAFIEKVCKFLDDRIKHDSIDYPMASVHLIDDFKNYIKGGISYDKIH